MMTKRKLLWSLVLLGICAFLVNTAHAWYLEREGYCAEKGRYISDREFILWEMLGNTAIDFGNTKQEVEDFLNKYPQCCNVSRSVSWFPWNNPTEEWGRHVVSVKVRGPTKFKADATAEYRTKFAFTERYVASNVCGRNFSLTYNDSTDKIPSWYQSK